MAVPDASAIVRNLFLKMDLDRLEKGEARLVADGAVQDLPMFPVWQRCPHPCSRCKKRGLRIMNLTKSESIFACSYCKHAWRVDLSKIRIE
jgi:hypothetical protein